MRLTRSLPHRPHAQHASTRFPAIAATMASVLGLTAGAFFPPGPALAETNEQADVSIENTVRDAIANSQRMYDHAFDVTVASKQMSALIQKKVTGGTPLPVRIDQLTLTHGKGDSSFKAKVAGLPPQLQPQIEEQLNAMIGKSNIGSLWSKTTEAFLDLTKEEMDAGGQLQLVKENEKAQVLAMEGLDRPFHDDVRLNAIRLIRRKKDNLITGARLHLTEAKDLTVVIEYDFVELDGEDTPLPVWSRMQIEQNSWMGKIFGFVGWPNKLTVRYSDYHFHGDGE